MLSKLSDLFSDIDNCVNHTCINGGSCVDGINSYSCSCVKGYTGDRCEKGEIYVTLATRVPSIEQVDAIHMIFIDLVIRAYYYMEKRLFFC